MYLNFFLLAINELFILKYCSRMMGGPIIALVMLAYGLIAWMVVSRRPIIPRWTLMAALSLFCLSIVCLWWMIPPDQIQVDRWDAVYCWWQKLFSGEYPWSARTRFGGFCSPLPFLQLVCLPVAFTKHIGVLTLLIIALYGTFTIFRKNRALATVTIFWLVLSPAVVWELLVHSTLMLNSFLFIPFFPLFQRYPVWVSGSIAGLLASTRISVLPLFLLVWIYPSIREKNAKVAFLFPTFCVLLAVLTLVPFIAGFGWNAFWAENPIVHQTNHMGMVYKVILLLFSVLLGLYSARDIARQIISAGMITFLMGSFFILHGLETESLSVLIFQSQVDISYLLFSFPFFLFSLREQEKSDREMGLFRSFFPNFPREVHLWKSLLRWSNPTALRLASLAGSWNATKWPVSQSVVSKSNT
ncbi:MAG TPA: hypothetical protein VLM37_04095 [Fibrobacteraceae bacterium]|nr:hypothetical protein [Fibrobacteraceae bacterium]